VGVQTETPVLATWYLENPHVSIVTVFFFLGILAFHFPPMRKSTNVRDRRCVGQNVPVSDMNGSGVMASSHTP